MKQHENIDAAAWRKLLDQQMQPLPSPLNLANLSTSARLRFQSAYKAQETVQKLRQLTSRIQADELLRNQHIPWPPELWLRQAQVGIECDVSREKH